MADSASGYANAGSGIAVRQVASYSGAAVTSEPFGVYARWQEGAETYQEKARPPSVLGVRYFRL